MILSNQPPTADGILQRWPVSKRVNSSRAPDDDPTLIDPLRLWNKQLAVRAARSCCVRW